MPNLKGPELLILILIVVLLFGAKRLPDAARSVGRSLRIFKAETKGLTEDTPTEAPPATAVTGAAVPVTAVPVIAVPVTGAPGVAPAVEPKAVPVAPTTPVADPKAGGSLSPRPPTQA